jgi:hypothetical protein
LAVRGFSPSLGGVPYRTLEELIVLGSNSLVFRGINWWSLQIIIEKKVGSIDAPVSS